MKEDVFKTH